MLPPDRQQHVRYLSAHNLTGEPRAEIAAALPFWSNSLSREPDIVRPVQVAPDLWRVDLRDYGWRREVWERLAAVDPYFHILGQDAQQFTEVKVTERIYHPGGRFRFPNGKIETFETPAGYYETEYTKLVAKEIKGLATPAPWLPAKEYAALATATASNLPVVRADWWIYQTGQQDGRKAGYYDWLGIKESKDYAELIGLDVKLAQKRKKEIAAVVPISGVGDNNRSIIRLQAMDGGYWETHDFKTSTFKQNVIRLLDGDTEPPRGDARELYGFMPNGLLAFFLEDADGKRQDFAPDFVGPDKRATRNSGKIQIGISCVRCHVEGIRPIDDYMRRVYNEENNKGGKKLELSSLDYEKFRRLRQLYLSELEGHIKEDRARYARTLLAVNGLTPEENAAAFASVWARYEGPVTLEIAAGELGLTPQEFLKQTAHIKDPVLDGFRAEKPVPARREHWEETYSVAYSYLKGSK